MRRLPAIASLVLLSGVLLASQERRNDPFKIQVAVDLVNVSFSAMDSKGRMIPGLTAQDFTVEEEGEPQTITLFAREQELPLTLALLVDVSPSVANVFNQEKLTASAFLESIIGRRDLALVIAFDRYATLIQDFTEDVRRLTNAVDSLRLKNTGTSLFDAVYLAADEKLSRETGRKAIVLISDGEDTTSTYNQSKAMIAVQRSNAVIYAISNGGNSGTMRRMAEETGGGFFRIREGSDFEKVFQQIALELRTQYSLAYQSTNTNRDGAFRRIKIIPRNSDIKIRARRGYYASQDSGSR
ncbi:MAG TPA: VWA domain-containing protein [Terriglobia bacterium]|nr:VWA domain-containing protein [Terriglobia bacterium]